MPKKQQSAHKSGKTMNTIDTSFVLTLCDPDLIVLKYFVVVQGCPTQL